MADWVFFLHPPRDDFIATMTDEERAAFGAHADWLHELERDRVLILAGPCLGRVNTGVAVFEAPDEPAARRIADREPVTQRGFMRGELRPFRVGIRRGRAEPGRA